jgi:excinuclease ABC subunit C
MWTVQAVRERQQKMASNELGDRDVFGVKLGALGSVVHVFLVRGGRVVERIEFVTDAQADAASDADVLEAAVQQFYQEQTPPPEIHVPVQLAEGELIESWLSGRVGRRVRLVVPQRGDKKGLIDLVGRNAALSYRTRFDANATANYDALESLQAALRLAALPRRIECFDISTIQGSETVAAMVVCAEGRMRPSEYRKFKVRFSDLDVRRVGTAANPDWRTANSGPSTGSGSSRAKSGDESQPANDRFLDDFAAMEQVVRRRYSRVLEQGGPFPDLIVIDGGKGQLNAAYAALEAVGLSNLVAIGLAKKEELVFTRDRTDPIAFDTHGAALRLLQRIRDEAHRFAVTFHRQSRAKRDLRSELDNVPGIGVRRRKTLLTAFGSLAGVRRATREELSAVVGLKAADAVIAYFAANP